MGLTRAFSQKVHTDLVVNLEGKSFRCHKVIMSAVSPYFDAMLSSGMRESISGEVNLHEINPTAFQNVLKYIYEGINVVTSENALQLLYAAVLLQVRPLQEICEDALEPQVTVENCLEIWKLALFHECTNLKQKSFQFICKNFVIISQTDEFMDLDIFEIESILEDDNICVQNEAIVCDTALRWLKMDLDKRKKYSGRLLKQVRLSFLTAEQLMMVTEKNKFLNSEAEAGEVIKEAMRFQLLPARQQELCGVTTTYRATADMEEVLVVLGGCETSAPPYKRAAHVICYSFLQENWFRLEKLPYDPGIEFASCTYGNDIYVSGGGCMQKCMIRFDSSKNKWSNMTPMAAGRRRHGMVAMTDSLYILGGYDCALEEGARMLASIEKYDLKGASSELVGELLVPVSSFSTAVIGEKIYMFGGETNDRRDTAAIQCFDPRHNTAYQIGYLASSCKLTRTVVAGEKIYVILFDGTVSEFDRDTFKSKKVGVIPSFKRIHYGAVHYKGDIVIVGGETLNLMLCGTVLRYSPTKNVRQDLRIAMPTPRIVDSCVKIAIQKKFLGEYDISESA